MVTGPRQVSRLADRPRGTGRELLGRQAVGARSLDDPADLEPPVELRIEPRLERVQLAGAVLVHHPGERSAQLARRPGLIEHPQIRRQPQLERELADELRHTRS